jgi:hypothetical protein
MCFTAAQVENAAYLSAIWQVTSTSLNSAARISMRHAFWCPAASDVSNMPPLTGVPGV